MDFKKTMDITDKNLREHVTFVKAIIITQIAVWHFYGFNVARNLSLSQCIGKVLSMTPSVSLSGLWLILVYFGGAVSKLFFLTSGFGLYLSHRSKPSAWPEFYRRRALRILPLYWLALVTIYVLTGDIPLGSLILHLFALQTFTPHYNDFSHMWFVGMLALFYMIFPLLAWCFSRSALKWPLVLISLIIGPLTPRALDYFGLRFDGLLPSIYLPYFILGMLLADVYVTNRKITEAIFSVKASLGAAAALAATLALQYKDMISADLVYVQLVLYFIALYVPYRIARTNAFVFNALGAVACASYVVYLTHLSLEGLILNYAMSHNLIDYVYSGSGSGSYFPSQAQFITTFIISYIFIVAISAAIQKYYNRYVYAKLTT